VALWERRLEKKGKNEKDVKRNLSGRHSNPTAAKGGESSLWDLLSDQEGDPGKKTKGLDAGKGSL